jgi:predicted nucleic acid-binding Zn ribbon protein
MSDEKPVLPDNKKRRNMAMLIVLLAFCAIVFAVTIVRMGMHG